MLLRPILMFLFFPYFSTFLLVQADTGVEWTEVHGVGITMAGDGSMVVVGRTDGDWDGVNAGSTDDVIGTDDCIAVRLDADGEEIWRYQVRIP